MQRHDRDFAQGGAVMGAYFFERVGRAFSFIGAAISMAFKDKDLLLPSILSLFAVLGYVLVVAMLLTLHLIYRRSLLAMAAQAYQALPCSTVMGLFYSTWG